MFSQISHEPVFHQLRTKERLGYNVSSGTHVHHTTVGYHIRIQSQHNPRYLEGRVAAFLTGFGETLKNLTTAEFEIHRNSVIKTLLGAPQNLEEEATLFWDHIDCEDFDFDFDLDSEVQAVRQLCKDDVVTFFNTYIDPCSHHRAKISVYMKAQANS